VKLLSSTILLVMILCGGCVPPPVPFPIANIEGDSPDKYRFRDCGVTLAMEGVNLVAECGEPHMIVPTADHRGACAIYRNLAHSLGSSSHSSPYIAVCVGEDRPRGMDVKPTHGEHMKNPDTPWARMSARAKLSEGWVYAYYGLRTAPGDDAVEARRPPASTKPVEVKREPVPLPAGPSEPQKGETPTEDNAGADDR
jgi:hypothetical protein